MKIRQLSELPAESVSHDAGILKRVLLRRGELPHLTQLAQSRIAPGQVARAHAHPDMVEVFLVEAGKGTVTVDGMRHRVAAGSCIAIEAGEEHEITAAGDTELVLTYFGIEV